MQLHPQHIYMTNSNLTSLCKIKQKNVSLQQHNSFSSAATLTFIFQTCDNYDITNDLLISRSHTYVMKSRNIQEVSEERSLAVIHNLNVFKGCKSVEERRGVSAPQEQMGWYLKKHVCYNVLHYQCYVVGLLVGLMNLIIWQEISKFSDFHNFLHSLISFFRNPPIFFIEFVFFDKTADLLLEQW